MMRPSRTGRAPLPDRELLRPGARVAGIAPEDRFDDERELAPLSALERQWRGFRRELVVPSLDWHADRDRA